MIFFQKIFKKFNRKPYYHEKKFHQEKDLYFSFHYVLKKRRSNFSFYISLYYTEVLIYRHTWPCIVNCYWSAEKQHKGSANRKKNKVCRCTGKYRLPYKILKYQLYNFILSLSSQNKISPQKLKKSKGGGILRCGGSGFSCFPQIQMTELWPWFLFQMGSWLG